MAKFTSYSMICILVLPEPKVSLGYNDQSFVLRLRTSASTCAPIRPVNRELHLVIGSLISLINLP